MIDFDERKNYLRRSKNLTLGVIGSRTFTDYNRMNFWINKIRSSYDIVMIVSGGRRKDGKGADTLAENWADNNDFPKLIFPPQYWKYPNQHAIVALLARNTDIAAWSDVILAFWDEKSTGTLDTMKKALEMKIISFIVNPDNKCYIYKGGK